MRPVLSLLLTLVLSALTAFPAHAEIPQYDPETLLKQHESALLKLASQQEAMAYFDKHFIKNYQEVRQLLSFVNGLTGGTYKAAAKAIIQGRVHSYRIDAALKSFKTVDMHLHTITRALPLTVNINEMANGMGYALTAVSVAGHMVDWFQGDDSAMKKAGVAAWKGVMDWGFNALERLGMRGVSVAMGGVLIIDYALNAFMEQAHAQYEKFWWTAYSNYLNQKYRQLATGSSPWVNLSPEDLDKRLLEFWNDPLVNAASFHKNPGPHQRDALAAADFQKPFAARYYQDFLHQPLKNYFRRQALNAEEEAWVKAGEYAEALNAQLAELTALREVLELAQTELEKGKPFERLSATLSTDASGGVSGTISPNDPVWLHYTYETGRQLKAVSVQLVLTAKNGKKNEITLPAQDFSSAKVGKPGRGKVDVAKHFKSLSPGPYRVKLLMKPDGVDEPPAEATTFVSVAEQASQAAQATPQPQPKPQPSVQQTPQAQPQQAPQAQPQPAPQTQPPTPALSTHTFTDRECVDYIYQENYEWLDKCLVTGWDVNTVGNFDPGAAVYDGLHAGAMVEDPVRMLTHLMSHGGDPNRYAHHDQKQLPSSVGQEILGDVLYFANRGDYPSSRSIGVVQLMINSGVVPTPCNVDAALDFGNETHAPLYDYAELSMLLSRGIAGNDTRCSTTADALLAAAADHPDERVLKLVEQATGASYQGQSGSPGQQEQQGISPACQQAMAEFQATDQRMRKEFEEYKAAMQQFLERVAGGLAQEIKKGDAMDTEKAAINAEYERLSNQSSVSQAEIDAYEAREAAHNAKVDPYNARLAKFQEFKNVWDAISEKDCGYAIVSIKDHPIAREFGYPTVDATRLCQQHGKNKLAYDAAMFKLKSNGCTQP